MTRYTLSAIIISGMMLLAACGNLVNDELASDEQDQTDITPEDSGFGTVIGSNFSTSGKIRIQSDPEGGYFLSSTIVGGDGRDELWLSYTDKNANSKWAASLKNTVTNDRASRIEVIDKDNILIFADRYYTDPALSSDSDLIIIKVNSSKGIVWQKCIGSLDKNLIYATVLTDDGGFLATGITVLKDVPEYKPFVIRVSPQGDIIWKKDYTVYLTPSMNKYFEIVRPTDIISLGNEEFMFSGTAVNPSNNKLVGFYCRIDGRAEGVSEDETPYGGGMLLDSTYIKAGNDTITVLGNICYSDCIVSVIGVTDTTLASPPAVYNIISMNRETLKVISKKEYEFESLRFQSGIVNAGSGDFTLAGMIKPAVGKGIYTLTFNKYGIIKELNTRYYDNISYDFLSVEFNRNYENSRLAYLIRLNTPGTDKEIFVDSYVSSSIKNSSVIKNNTVMKADVVVVVGDPDIQETENAVGLADSVLFEIADPGLVFNRY